MLTPKSPEWKKPSDVMKIHRKKKIPGAGYLPRGDANRPTTDSTGSSPSTVSHKNKRKNPFGCSPRKRAHVSPENRDPSETTADNTAQDGLLFSALNRKDKDSSKDDTCTSSIPPSTIDGLELEGSLSTKNTPHDNITKPVVTDMTDSLSCSRGFPCDWSLKMKCRFVSRRPFSWCGSLKTADQANGIHKFLEQSGNKTALSDQEISGQTSDVKAELYKCLLYWVHPNIPWLKLFPRMVADSKIGKVSVLMQDKEVLESMMSDWTDSFTSAFLLLRSGACPYLYVCCHQFTVAFFAAKTRSSESPLEAVVTPTSRGFRESLKAEGIEFDLPLEPKSSANSSSPKSGSTSMRQACSPISQNQLHPEASVESTPADKCDDKTNPDLAQEQCENNDDDDEEDLEATDDGAASWLETLGLNKRHYRSLDPNKVKLQRDSFRVIDNRPESTVYVKGTQTQALFNFLLNCRSCMANTGIQAGIPPTLLTSTAFKGATLKSLKMKQGSLRQQGSDASAYSLEMTGPILPSAYIAINSLLASTQSEYTATYGVLDPTTPLNMCVDSPEKPSPVDDDSTVKALNIPLGKDAIRELTFNDGKYVWNKY